MSVNVRLNGRSVMELLDPKFRFHFQASTERLWIVATDTNEWN
ncbi:MAG: hypothetical protein ACR2JB_24900 [Bryobacteraceae bacterium]